MTAALAVMALKAAKKDKSVSFILKRRWLVERWCVKCVGSLDVR